MTRYRMIHGQNVAYSAEEEAQVAKEDQIWNDEAPARALARLREKRNYLLAETDFYALSDVTMSEAMTNYRQNLRDLPSGLSTVEDVESVTYPTKPE